MITSVKLGRTTYEVYAYPHRKTYDVYADNGSRVRAETKKKVLKAAGLTEPRFLTSA